MLRLRKGPDLGPCLSPTYPPWKMGGAPNRELGAGEGWTSAQLTWRAELSSPGPSGGRGGLWA